MFTAHVHAYKPQLTTGRYNDSMQHLSPLPTHPLEQGQLNNHHTTLFSLLPTLHLSDQSAMLQGTCQPNNTWSHSALSTALNCTARLIISMQTYLQTVLPSSSMQEVREGKQQSASGPPHRSSRRGAHARTAIWCHVALQTEESGSTHSCTRIGQRHPKAPRRSLSSGVTWLIRSLVG